MLLIILCLRGSIASNDQKVNVSSNIGGNTVLGAGLVSITVQIYKGELNCLSIHYQSPIS